jgi:hypothetical protein
MKAFWVAVGLLMIGAAVYLLMWSPSHGGAMMPVSREVVAESSLEVPAPAPAKPALAAKLEKVDEPVALVVPKPVTPPAAAPGPQVVQADAPPTIEPEPKAAVEAKSDPKATAASSGASGPAGPGGAKEPGPGTAPLTDGEGDAKAADPLAAKVETKDDGSMVVDGKYVVRGKGTAEEPFKVTWDQLLSAQDDYVPKEGRKKVPGRITMLDGKWVEVTGYIAFPVMAESQDEALSMMNQWDGCCIGVPPTPYDAIEVRLKKPAEGNARLTTYGTMKGKFKVDPHLVGGWLVGLYVMDSASMSPQSYGGFSP